MSQWKRIVKHLHDAPHISGQDECFFVMEYIRGGGYQASRANQLIINFKKSKNTQNPAETHHIDRSIDEFTAALTAPIEYYCRQLEQPVGLVSIPRAKLKTDSGYSDGLEVVGLKLASKFGNRIRLETPIVNKKSREKSSQTGETRNRQYIEGVKANFEWRGLHSRPRILLIYDDVLTSGAQFTAVKEFINQNIDEPDRPKMVGLFWAKAIHPNPVDQIKELE